MYILLLLDFKYRGHVTILNLHSSNEKIMDTIKVLISECDVFPLL